MPRRRTRDRLDLLRRLARDQDGSFLVEALVSALIIVIVGLGVLEMIDRSARLGGQQRAQAVAGNVAQSEQEQVRALAIDEQSNLRRTTTRTIDGVTYTIATRSEWVNDASDDAQCTTPGASVDYMKLSTVVTWPQISTRKPFELESLIAPPVRSFTSGQGALAVQVLDRNGAGVPGVQLGLSGPKTLSDATSDSGCVMWGYLDAGSGYSVRFSRPPDYVAPDGSLVIDKPATVASEQTANVAAQYDRGGTISTSFTTKRTTSSAVTATNPSFAHVTQSGGGGISRAFPVSGDRLTTDLLFPFTSAYTVHADTCAATEVPIPAPPPTPPFPAAPSVVTAIVTPGATAATAAMRLPAVNIRVTAQGTPVDGAEVRVTTPCGTVYRRRTTSTGFIDDPGFPFASSLAVCVSNGVRRREAGVSNTNFNSTSAVIDIRSTDPSGTCA